MQTFA